MLRWFVPIVTILVLAGRSVMVFAAAGPQLDLQCCCPDPKICKCHHHPGGDETTMKRCSGAEHEVSPVAFAITVPTPPDAIEIPRIARAIVHPIPAIPDDWTSEPEKPPF